MVILTYRFPLLSVHSQNVDTVSKFQHVIPNTDSLSIPVSRILLLCLNFWISLLRRLFSGLDFIIWSCSFRTTWQFWSVSEFITQKKER